MPRPGNRIRLSGDNLGALQCQAGITFLGPTDGWPYPYSAVFQRVQEIGQESFANYVARPTAERSVVAQMELRASELADNAYDNYRRKLNEATLRFSTEPAVFRRFDYEATWLVKINNGASLVTNSLQCTM